ncbi:MAG: helix-turn-helix transcriptional regulator [Methyloceanibacter sp.]
MKTTASKSVVDADDQSPPEQPRAPERGEIFLTPKEAAKYLHVSKSYLDKLRVYGGGPKFLRFGTRKILYRTADLDLWASGQCFFSTSEYRRPRSR